MGCPVWLSTVIVPVLGRPPLSAVLMGERNTFVSGNLPDRDLAHAANLLCNLSCDGVDFKRIDDRSALLRRQPSCSRFTRGEFYPRSLGDPPDSYFAYAVDLLGNL